MNSTRLRALAMKHAFYSANCAIATIGLAVCAWVGYVAHEWLILLAASISAFCSLIYTLDNLSAFFRFRTLYRIQADEESRWIR